MSNITDAELEKLKAAKTQGEWNAACDEIKKARGGQYPADWWAKVKLSGIMDEAVARFGGGGITVSVVKAHPLDPWR